MPDNLTLERPAPPATITVIVFTIGVCVALVLAAVVALAWLGGAFEPISSEDGCQFGETLHYSPELGDYYCG